MGIFDVFQKNMVTIGYSIGCRSCNNSDGINHITLIKNCDLASYQKMTEFHLMEVIEQTRKESNNVCEFCGSDNVEPLDLTINEKLVFNSDSIRNSNEFVFVLTIEKIKGKIKASGQGSNYRDRYAGYQGLKKMTEELYNRDETFFSINETGFLYAMVSGTPAGIGCEYVCSLQKLKHTGFSQNEILDILDSLQDKL